jgi:uncharacterized protein YgbK (DUF1537 family)
MNQVRRRQRSLALAWGRRDASRSSRADIRLAWIQVNAGGHVHPGSELRLLADDLTGALDAAAEFVGMVGPIDAFWHGAIPAILPANAALDSGTRELDRDAATRIVAALVPALDRAAVAFKKVDSLMRGPTLAEIAACIRAGSWGGAIMAPAFPYQGRVTRGGIQYVRDTQGHWSAIGGNLVTRLRDLGVRAQPGLLDTHLPLGISVFDAEADADLDRVVAIGRSAGVVLWIGTGGLAQALARGTPPPSTVDLPLPVLGFLGSDHAVAAAQLAACGADWMPLRDAGPSEVQEIAARLRNVGRVVTSLQLPAGLDRELAAFRIATALGRLVGGIPRPGTLLVAGGETLRSLCICVGAHSLAIQGRLEPGVPRSLLRGGVWEGVTIISKSGAFGRSTLLHDLLHGRSLPLEG